MDTISRALREHLFIGSPPLTEKNLPDQTGRVHIVTGGYAGCGFELSKILYGHNATVYVAGRNPEKADKAIASIKEAHPEANGKITFLKIDFSDLKTIKPAAEEFMSKEKNLHVLTNNAGVMMPPQGSKDVQGNELQLGTNCIGPYLFTKFLLPVLRKTAEEAPSNSVRVTWASSAASFLFAPKDAATINEHGDVVQHPDIYTAYGQSKAGNNLLGAELARRYGKDGIISVSFNPGHLKSELGRHLATIPSLFFENLAYAPIFGAYTELYAACSPDLTSENNGCYIAPWGRVVSCRPDVAAAMKTKDEGGSGIGQQFWEWCDKITKEYS